MECRGRGPNRLRTELGDGTVNWVLDLCCKNVPDDRRDLIGSSNSHHRRAFYEVRSYTLFYGTIHKMDIFDPYGFSPELGAAIARFPRLEEVTFVSNAGPDWYDEVRGRKATLDPKAIPNLIVGITSLKRLRKLEFSAPWLGDQEVLAFAQIPSLEIVSLQGRLSATSLSAFIKLPRLRELNLQSDELHDEEVRVLAAIPTLEVVGLQGEFTAASFPAFANHPKLKNLTLRSGKTIARDEISRLERSLPGVDVQVDAPKP